MAVAECVGLVDGDACRVAGRVDAPFADVVELAPESERDWLELLECAEDVEANLLTQCGCVVEGAPFPFWPGGDPPAETDDSDPRRAATQLAGRNARPYGWFPRRSARAARVRWPG